MNKSLKIVLLVLAGLAGLYLFSMPVRDWVVKDRLREYIAGVSGRPVVIEQLQLGVCISPLRVRGLRIESPDADGETLLHLARVDMDFNLPSLLTGRPHITGLALDLDLIRFVKHADGTTNFDWTEGLMQRRGGKSGSATVLAAIPPRAADPPVSPEPELPRLRPLPTAAPEPGEPVRSPPAGDPGEAATSTSNRVTRAEAEIAPPLRIAGREVEIDRFELRIRKVLVRDFSMNAEVPMKVDLHLEFRKVYLGISDADTFVQLLKQDLADLGLGESIGDFKLLK